MVATDTCSQLLFNFIRTVRTSLFSFNVVVDVCGQCIGCSCSFQRFSRRNGIVPSVLDFKGQDDVFQCIVISVLNLDYLGFSIHFVVAVCYTGGSLFGKFHSRWIFAGYLLALRNGNDVIVIVESYGFSSGSGCRRLAGFHFHVFRIKIAQVGISRRIGNGNDDIFLGNSVSRLCLDGYVIYRSLWCFRLCGSCRIGLTCLFKHDGCNLGVFFRTSGGYVDGGGILLFRIFYFRSLNGASVSLLHLAEFYGCWHFYIYHHQAVVGCSVCKFCCGLVVIMSFSCYSERVDAGFVHSQWVYAFCIGCGRVFAAFYGGSWQWTVGIGNGTCNVVGCLTS